MTYRQKVNALAPQLFEKLYDLAGGKRDEGLQFHPIAEQLRWERQFTLDVVGCLEEAGYIKQVARGIAHITPDGVDAWKSSSPDIGFQHPKPRS